MRLASLALRAVGTIAAFIGCTMTPSAGSPDRPPRASPSSVISSVLRDQGYVGVPTRRLKSGHYQAVAQVGGQRLSLIIDSGASTSFLDDATALRLGLSLQQSRTRVSGLGAPAQRTRSARLDDVRLGGLRLDSLPVVVLDLSHVNQSLRDEGIELADGVIGADLLAEREAVFDFASGVLYLR
ncbi:MAG TPA: retropepsin-like aspartic protease [Gemmatimonadaceae bacterium]|nr:retropepsin-like aspartic protease [Gemmatimonadaceae bacterium]